MKGQITRVMTNILTDDLISSASFYLELFDFEKTFDSNWFIQLVSNHLEIGLIDSNSDIIPYGLSRIIGGCYITIVVANCEDVYTLAKAKNYEIIQEPHDTFYGQRRLILKDPNGVLVDVSSLI